MPQGIRSQNQGSPMMPQGIRSQNSPHPQIGGPTNVGSPCTPGDQNQGSPMMPQGIRSQNPGMPNQMNSLPNNPSGMNNMRMSGPGGQMDPMNPGMGMMRMQQPHMMHQHQM